MNKNLSTPDLKALVKQLQDVGSKLQRFSLIIFIVFVVGIYGFLILNISSAYSSQTSSADIAEEVGTIKGLKIDQESIDKIRQLEDQNVSVQSLFKEARENPFFEE